MPRTIPQACSAIAADIASLEAADQAIRTELASATGAAAWAALARLGQRRQALERKRAEFDLCVRNNSPALQGNLVVMNVASSGDGPLARVAHLWDLTQSTASEREASPVQADAFSFKGPLPGEFGLTIATTGSPTIIGPDFRSAAITPQSLPLDASVRVEILLLPDIRIEQDEVSRLVAAFTPSVLDIATSTGDITGRASVNTADATLSTSGLQGRLSGQIEITSVFGGSDRGPFSASANVSVVPLMVPRPTDVCDLIAASDLSVDLPGVLGQLAQAVLPFARPALTKLLTDHLRTVLPSALVHEVVRALVLPNLPPDVTVSVRRLTTDATGITFQPALGTIGTTLSAFIQPVIPPL